MLEFLLDLPTCHEDIPDDFFVAESGSHQDSVHTRPGQLGKEEIDIANVRFTVNGRVGAHSKSQLLGCPDPGQAFRKPPSR